MGSKQCKAVVEHQEVLRLLKKSELALVQNQFHFLSGQHNLKGKIEKEKFFSGLLEPAFGGTSSVVMERLYFILDTNGNGTIEYSEFLVATFLLYYANHEDKLKLVFNLFDLEAVGKISKKDFKKISIALMQGDNEKESDKKVKTLNPLIDMFVYFSMFNFDRKNDNTLSFMEWTRYAEDDDIITALVAKMRPLSIPPTPAPDSQLHD